MESGENARTKLGSFLVFLVDGSAMEWLFLLVYENGDWSRTVDRSGDNIKSSLDLPSDGARSNKGKEIQKSGKVRWKRDKVKWRDVRG